MEPGVRAGCCSRCSMDKAVFSLSLFPLEEQLLSIVETVSKQTPLGFLALFLPNPRGHTLLARCSFRDGKKQP